MSKLTLICPNGHDMNKTRRRKPTGKTYCIKCKCEQVTRWREQNRGSKRCSINLRRNMLKRVYKMTMEDFDILFEAQKRKCAICYSAEPKARNWSIDHDHETGKIRGILCSPCNCGIGLLKESEEILTSAIEYLRRSMGI